MLNRTPTQIRAKLELTAIHYLKIDDLKPPFPFLCYSNDSIYPLGYNVNT